MAYIVFVVLSTEEDVQVIHKQKSRNKVTALLPLQDLNLRPPD